MPYYLSLIVSGQLQVLRSANVIFVCMKAASPITGCPPRALEL